MTDSAPKRSVLVLVLSGLASVAFLGAGGAKLAGAPELVQAFQHFGLSHGFMLFIGVCEIAGAIGLWLPRLAPLAAAGLTMIVAGAVVEHVTHDPASKAIPAAVLTVLCAFLAYSRRGEMRPTSPLTE